MEFEELIRTRRSVRSYQKERTVDRSVIEELLKSAQLAPSWKNTQTGRYYVVDTPEKLAAVRSTCLPTFNQESCSHASALLVTSFVRNIAGYQDGQPENELGNKWGAYDLGLQSAYLVLKAASLGLDTLIMGLRDEKELRKQLAIPEQEEVAAVIALGYRDGEPTFRPRREWTEIVKFY